MNLRPRLALYLITALLAVGRLASAQDQPNIADYIDPASAYHTGDIDYVDVLNGRVALNIPLVIDHSQRGNLNFTYSLRYAATTQWGVVNLGGQAGWAWRPAYGTITSPHFSMDGDLLIRSESFDCSPYYYCQADSARDENGSIHYLGTTSGIDGNPPFTGESVDGSGIAEMSSGSILANPQGIQFVQIGGNLGDVTAGSPAYVQDPSGNRLSFSCSDQYHDCSLPSYTRSMTDTVGRVWTYTAGSGDLTGCPGGAIKSEIWTIPGPNGQTRQFKFCYSASPISTQFGESGVQEEYGSAALITAVLLPDGTMWQFDYDNYGAIHHVYLPTGGTITYGWTTTTAGANATHMLSSRTRYDGTNSSIWTYNGFKVTDPAGNDTVYTPQNPSNVICDERLTTVQYYSGSSGSGTLLKTAIYPTNAPNGTNGYKLLNNPYPQEVGACTVSYLPSAVETQWPNGATNETAQTYDTGFSFTDSNTATQYQGVYGLVTQENDYDYGSNNPGSVLSTTNTVYYYQQNSNYESATENLLNFPYTQTVMNGATQMAQTTFVYDENNGSPQCICGNLTSVARWLNTAGTSPKTQYVYNSNGMWITMIDPNGNTTQYTYDGTGAFLTSIHYPNTTGGTGTFQHIEGFSHDSNTGVPLSHTDQNNQTTYYRNYDLMLRPQEIDYPDGGQTTLSFSDVYPFTNTVTRKITASLSNVTTSVFDGLGRLTQTQSSSGQGTIYVDRTYDANGHLYSVTNRHYNTSGATDGTTIYFPYDALDRIMTITEPGGNTINYQYTPDGNALEIHQTDEAGDTRNSWMDGLGRTFQVNLFPNGVARTKYTYDALNNLTKADESGSNWSNDRIRTFTYDSLSRLISAANPESGTETYTYDANGNLKAKTVPQANQSNPSVTTIIAYCYDALNRLHTVSYTSQACNPDNSGSWNYFWAYDGDYASNLQYQTNLIGRLTVECNDFGPMNSLSDCDDFGYDTMGRSTYDSTSLPHQYSDNGADYDQFYTYDLGGDRTSESIIGVSGGMLSYSHDSGTRLTGVTTNLTDSQHPATFTTVDPSVGYWPTGEVRVMTLGNGLAETSVYNNRLEPCRMNVNSSGTYLASCTGAVPNGNRQDFSYGYSTNWNNGDIWSWTASGTQNFNRSYTYDGANRLITMSAPSDPSGCTGLSWTYDAWGNRTDQTVTGGSCNTFHAAVNTNNQLVAPPYQYDAAGNLINDGVHTYTYDPEHRVTGVDGGTTTYEYDAEGRRVETVKSGAWTDYYHGLGSHVTAELSAAGYGTRYVYFGSRLLAEYTNGTSGSTYFVHPDHLGSTRLMTTYSQTQGQNQQVYDSIDYLPFGEQIAGSTGTTHKFTGQERDSESGNDNFGARHYGSRMGRFLSPDPSNLSVDFWMSQTWNRYAYVLNNPLSMVDRNGLWPGFWHNVIYEEALPGLSHNAMQLLEQGSEVLDLLPGSQDPENAFKHSMRNGENGQTVAQAEEYSDNFVAQNQHDAQQIEAEWLKSGHSGIAPAAVTAFANVAHTISERTSPAHREFQPWYGTKGWRNKIRFGLHSAGELIATPSEIQQSVKDVRSAFDETFGQFGFDEFTLLDIVQNQPQACVISNDSATGSTVTTCN